MTEAAGPPSGPAPTELPPAMTEPPGPAMTEPPGPAATEPSIRPAPLAAAPLAAAPVESTRHLLGASFDLLTRTSDDMRRASFYIGAIVLGTVGPFALASLALAVVSIHMTGRELDVLLDGSFAGWYAVLELLAGLGLFVAFVESRTIAAALLGGHLAQRPVAVRGALARSRMAFWRVFVGLVIVGIPVLIAQSIVDAGLERLLGGGADAAFISSALVAALVGAPLAYVLSGIVLGDVDPFEATRRSFRVFDARRSAAVLVAVFETVAILLVVLGLGAGLDIALRVFGALGLGLDSGPVGLALITIGVIAGVFALGTLVYTALALSLAPQVVMFVGLTQATIGLDHVRPGGDHDPASHGDRGRSFRWLTRPMRIGMALGVIGLAIALSMLAG